MTLINIPSPTELYTESVTTKANTIIEQIIKNLCQQGEAIYTIEKNEMTTKMANDIFNTIYKAFKSKGYNVLTYEYGKSHNSYGYIKVTID